LMLNPYSAVNIVKSSLEYNLGYCMMCCFNNGAGYLDLFVKLKNIKNKYIKNIKFKSKIKINKCLDYHFAYIILHGNEINLGKRILKTKFNFFKLMFLYYTFNVKFKQKIINPSISWKLSSNINNHIDFIFLTSHCTGHYSLQSYLNKILNSNNTGSSHYNYKAYYKDIIKYNYNFISIAEFDKDYFKFASTINVKTNFLILVRDPISALKSAMNFAFLPPNMHDRIIYNFNDLDKIISLIKYPFHDSNQINVSNIKKYIISETYHNHLCIQNTLFNYVKNNSKNIFFIDTKDIEPNNVENSIKQIQHCLNLPKIDNFDIFKNKAYTNVSSIFPLLLKMSKIDILIKMKSSIQNNYIHDIELNNIMLNCNNYLSDLSNRYSIDLFILKDRLNYLKDNIYYIQDYIEKIMKYIENKSNKQKMSELKENDIISFLNQDDFCRKRIKLSFDYETYHVKKYRPDIVNNWNFYNMLNS
ncbi:DUF2972 domain-containing protein, partial [Campylobacter lari]|nr:DUF2972 domain-containing protein [Campylobacter lari]EAL3935870.1 DUF2972 domain-containing protein [Campylobacter lari]